jgi:class 3 adenylate cyclase
MLNERQDYFGQTVNIAARVQGLCDSRAIYATAPVVGHGESAKLLRASGIAPLPHEKALRGIAEKMNIFEIP